MGEERVVVAGPLDAFRQFFSLQRDVLVLSLAMFAFSLGFQMTNRFLPDYLLYLGATGSSSACLRPWETSSARFSRIMAGWCPTVSGPGSR